MAGTKPSEWVIRGEVTAMAKAGEATRVTITMGTRPSTTTDLELTILDQVDMRLGQAVQLVLRPIEATK